MQNIDEIWSKGGYYCFMCTLNIYGVRETTSTSLFKSKCLTIAFDASIVKN